MNKQEKNKKLIAIINEAIEKSTDYKETIPAEEAKDASDIINVLNSALYRLGVRKSKSTTAPKDAFKKKDFKNNDSIKNKPPKNAFERKDLKEGSSSKIKNEAPKDAFKRKEMSFEHPEQEEAIKRTGNKWNKRLNQEKKNKIKEMFSDGFSAEEISEELWIEEKSIAKVLGIKAPSVLIADNSKNETDEFIQQVKESKNG